MQTILILQIRMKKKILVTGGAGFVGKNLVQRLLQQGEQVVVLDNFYSSDREEFLDIFQEDLKKGDLILFEEDITNEGVFVIRGGPFKAIFNLACPASPRYYERDFMYTVDINLRGTKKALETAILSNCLMIQASTSEIYGDPEVQVQSEEYTGNLNTQGIRNCYAEGKRLAESMCWFYRKRYGVDARIVRIFNAFGPGMQIDDGRVIPEFITRILRRQRNHEYGTSSRSFMYIDDLIDGLIKAMEVERWSVGGPINLGDDRNHYPISQVFDTLWYMIRGSQSRAWNREIDLVMKPRTFGDPKDRKPDITKAGIYLHWFPKSDFREGLQNTVDYFRKKIQKSS